MDSNGELLACTLYSTVQYLLYVQYGTDCTVLYSTVPLLHPRWRICWMMEHGTDELHDE
jgi:hypothetical protein